MGSLLILDYFKSVRPTEDTVLDPRVSIIERIPSISYGTISYGTSIYIILYYYYYYFAENVTPLLFSIKKMSSINCVLFEKFLMLQWTKSFIIIQYIFSSNWNQKLEIDLLLLKKILFILPFTTLKFIIIIIPISYYYTFTTLLLIFINIFIKNKLNIY